MNAHGVDGHYRVLGRVAAGHALAPEAAVALLAGGRAHSPGPRGGAQNTWPQLVMMHLSPTPRPPKQRLHFRSAMPPAGGTSLRGAALAESADELLRARSGDTPPLRLTELDKGFFYALCAPAMALTPAWRRASGDQRVGSDRRG